MHSPIFLSILFFMVLHYGYILILGDYIFDTT